MIKLPNFRNGLKLKIILCFAILLIISGSVYAFHNPPKVLKTAPTKSISTLQPKPVQTVTPATTPAATPSPTPTVTSNTVSVASGSSTAQQAYDCVEYQSQTDTALNTAVNGITSSTDAAANNGFNLGLTGQAETDYINQIYTSGNSQLQTAYNSYTNSFDPGVPGCSPNATAPVPFTLLN